MSHVMKSGKPCGRPDGHNGCHSSPETVEKKRVHTRQYNVENHDAIREQQREYYTKNQDAIRERMRESQADLHRQAVALYGTECECCGSMDRLEIDHIYGAGHKHLREMFNNNTRTFWRWLIKNHPAGFQVLCGACNNSKHDGEACLLDHALDLVA